MPMNLFTYLQKRGRKIQGSLQKQLFNFTLHPQTIANRIPILEAAERALQNSTLYESDDAYMASADPVIQQGYQLRQQIFNQFFQRHAKTCQERFLIHVPEAQFSPAGFSLFTNLAESLQFLGIPTEILGWHDDFSKKLAAFEPTIFLTSEHTSYTERIDWALLEQYKQEKRLRIGITAPLTENDLAINEPKLAWSRSHGVDFFISFRDSIYAQTHPVYLALKREGFDIIFIPFGANVLHYYPVAGFTKDLDYALLASRKREHLQFLRPITHHFPGFIDGPGWHHVQNFSLKRERDRYIYARTKIGLNIHLQEQRLYSYELNERTYQLAACGVPQLIDRPLLLERIFGEGTCFIADHPKDYYELFQYLIEDPNIAQTAALKAQQLVFQQHTTFHRADQLLDQLH